MIPNVEERRVVWWVEALIIAASGIAVFLLLLLGMWAGPMVWKILWRMP